MKTINKTIETILQVSEDGEHTYSVTKFADGEKKKHLILVTLYPTRNEKNIGADDSTMNYILTHLEEMGFDSVTVLYLFSKVVNGSRMSMRGIEVDRENLDYIKLRYIENEAFQDSTWVVAWGSACSSSKTVNRSKIELLEMWEKRNPKGKIYQLTTKGMKNENPLHPLYLGIHSKYSVWELKVFQHKKYVEKLKKQEEERVERSKEKNSSQD